MTALNFFLTVVENMRPVVTVESVRYLVYICFKVLFLANIGYLRTYKTIFNLQTSELIHKMPLVGSCRFLSALVGN